LVSFHDEIVAIQDKKNKALSELQQFMVFVENLRIDEQISDEDMKNSNASLTKRWEELRAACLRKL
jgi:hypothetical protein